MAKKYLQKQMKVLQSLQHFHPKRKEEYRIYEKITIICIISSINSERDVCSK